MKFFTDPTWHVLFLLATVSWLLGILREVYRFRLLRSRFRLASTVLAVIVVFIWVSMFFAMVATSGLLSGLFTYAVFFIAHTVFFVLINRKRASLFHPESLAQYEYEKAVNQSIIAEVTSRTDVQQLLSEYEKTPDFLANLMERLVSTGHRKALPKLTIISHVKHVLEAYARNDCSDADKFIYITFYLEDKLPAS